MSSPLKSKDRQQNISAKYGPYFTFSRLTAQGQTLVFGKVTSDKTPISSEKHCSLPSRSEDFKGETENKEQERCSNAWLRMTSLSLMFVMVDKIRLLVEIWLFGMDLLYN